jgi:hypothetical protein
MNAVTIVSLETDGCYFSRARSRISDHTLCCSWAVENRETNNTWIETVMLDQRLNHERMAYCNVMNRSG